MTHYNSAHRYVCKCKWKVYAVSSNTICLKAIMQIHGLLFNGKFKNMYCVHCIASNSYVIYTLIELDFTLRGLLLLLSYFGNTVTSNITNLTVTLTVQWPCLMSLFEFWRINYSRNVVSGTIKKKKKNLERDPAAGGAVIYNNS